ncbi:MAG TPA: hypothetical protein VLV16_12860 [Gemmatimonadales bacterium]|nr:hypothetical protein [Gemmatimonadales bacterium]
MEDALAIVFLFGGGTLFLLAISPIGRAIADRIRGTGNVGRATGQADEVAADVQALRREVAELAERMDFLERLQAKPRDADRLAPPR